MYKYDFVTKQSAHIFDAIEHVILSCNATITLDCTTEECRVIELQFPCQQQVKRFVGYPVKALKQVVITRIHEDGMSGQLSIHSPYGMRKATFNIYNDKILYLTF